MSSLMTRPGAYLLSALLAVLLSSGTSAEQAPAPRPDDENSCRAWLKLSHLTITSALIAETPRQQRYCYVQGNIAPAIRFHLQLPLPSRWNRRFLMVGDGGRDGVLNFANLRVDEGYAADSNGGHDAGAEPGWSFAFNNRQAEIGVVDDERKVCAHPRRAVYVGPPGGQHDRANWLAKNFECRQP